MRVGAETRTSSRGSPHAVEVRLPASTSNLGSGFDCFGLALQLYLTIKATIDARSTVKCRIKTTGAKENASLPGDSENLIYRSLAYTADREGVNLPSINLTVHNDIPLSRGLGGSAAAIVGGIKLCEGLCNRQIPEGKILQYAAEFEGHPDNIAATLLGGFVATCTAADGTVIALKRQWPSDLQVVIVSPESQVETKLARAALPRVVNRSDAVHNLQRSALFIAAIAERRYDLLWEAMKDRLHQQRRQELVPGIAEALALRKMPGLVGVALSGAGPSVLALADSNFEEIGEAVAVCFRPHKVRTTVRRLEVDNEGCQTRMIR